jgi:hypothetical protein
MKKVKASHILYVTLAFLCILYSLCIKEPRINLTPISLPPIRNLTPIGRPTAPERPAPLTSILKSQQDATNAAKTAVSVFSQAVANCQVNVSCDQAKRNFGETTQLVKVASQAFQTSAASVKAGQEALKEVNGTDSSEAALVATDSTRTSAKQAAVTLEATATALASCEVIVNLTCSQCPGGVVTPRSVDTPRATDIINDIRSQIANFMNS